jgi:cytochrome P450
VLVLAGLDTTRGQLGYLFQYLAEHDEDRQRIIDDPSLIPGCVEESLRMHAITIADSRKVTKDADFHGCPVKKGDMVMGLVAAANRDPRRYERADEFIMDREGAPHFGFAAGPHRCLGAHLARRELQIAVDEWHKIVPHYRIETAEPLIERGGQLALLSLPLAWDVAPGAGS